MLPSLLPNLALYFSLLLGFNVDKGLCFVLLLLVFGIYYVVECPFRLFFEFL